MVSGFRASGHCFFCFGFLGFRVLQLYTFRDLGFLNFEVAGL